MKLTLNADKNERLDVFVSENSEITRSYAGKLVERGLNLLMVFRIGDGEDFARGRVKFKSSVGNECL